MGQGNALEFLKVKYPKWFTAKEVGTHIGVDRCIYTTMKKLRKARYVKDRKRMVGYRKVAEYQYKI